MEANSPPPERVSRGAFIAMGAIVVALLVVAIYANWQHARRDRIESVTVTRFTPAPTPTPKIAP